MMTFAEETEEETEYREERGDKEFGKVAVFDVTQDIRKVTIQALFSLPKALEQCKNTWKIHKPRRKQLKLRIESV